MPAKSDDLASMIEIETQRRIDIYHDFSPGTSECEVEPFTIQKNYTGYYFLIFTYWLIHLGGVFIFPKYFPS